MQEKENTSEIKFSIHLNNDKIPDKITWVASGSTSDTPQPCNAFLISIWDHHYKESLRIDLWTKDMKQDEMNMFFFQTFMAMADTFKRANANETLADKIKNFATQFGKDAGVIK